MFKSFMGFISCILSGGILAATASDVYADNHLLVGLSAGPTWISGNKTQTLNLEPDVVKKYTADDQNSAFPSVELFLGWQQSWFASSIGQGLLSQLGISVAGAGNAKLGGDIWEDADPTFDNFNYSYRVNHEHVAIMGRLAGDCNRLVEPYISVSLGVGFNHAYDFYIYPKISEEVAAPGFKSNTTTTFTYTLGIGLQKSLNQHLQAAIGYEFADWGKVQLSRAPGQTVGQGLSLDHLYAHQLQISLFYTF